MSGAEKKGTIKKVKTGQLAPGMYIHGAGIRYGKIAGHENGADWGIDPLEYMTMCG